MSSKPFTENLKPEKQAVRVAGVRHAIPTPPVAAGRIETEGLYGMMSDLGPG